MGTIGFVRPAASASANVGFSVGWSHCLMLACLVVISGLARPVFADGGVFSGAQVEALFPEFSLDGVGQQNASVNTDPVTVLATAAKSRDRDIQIDVTIKLAKGWHVYSMTQPAGGPLPTRLSIQSPADLRVGMWSADREPAKSVSEQFGGITIEEFDGQVTFTAVATLPSGKDLKQIGDIQIAVDALACIDQGACLPIEEVVTATLGDTNPNQTNGAKSFLGLPGLNEGALPSIDDLMAQVNAGQADQVGATGQSSMLAASAFRDGDYQVQWTASTSKATVLPGQVIALEFTAQPDQGYHVYTAATDDSDSRTNFVITESSGLRVGAPQTTAAVEDYEFLPGVTYHPGAVTWTLSIAIPEDTPVGLRTIRGGIAYQACQETSCQQPMALAFAATVEVAPADSMTTAVSGPVSLTSTKRADVLDAAATIDWVDDARLAADLPVTTPDTLAAVSDLGGSNSAGGTGTALVAWLFQTFPGMLALAFIGGVILNFMPCVLPVVGLKVMSFVQQAGEQRGRIFALNLVYATGILAVFGLLAGLAVGASFGWGEQFTFMSFRLGLTILLFALALSYLGVWEIPAPGFASGEASQKLGNQEGYVGAFFKGMFATLLATPCSGPLLGAILGATINLSPVQTVAIMMTVGIGMALPYLIIGLRPELVSWLPKPGPWMETLKEFLAFLFLGTVAFFFYGFSDEHKVPVFITLIGVWFGCWIIGKVPNWAALQKRVLAWLVGGSAAALIGFAAFAGLRATPPGETLINWQPYSEARLSALQDEGKTVILDFTADWCINCKVNERYALNTEPTRQLLDELDAVAMVADWSDRDNPEIKQKLQELESRSIPVLAIYPGRQPKQPIILRDLVTQSAVLEALQQAGPSRSRPGLAANTSRLHVR